MEAPKIIIAVDGYSSSGKSSMAKALARSLGYNYVDTGAMYRAVTLYAMCHGLIAADGAVDTEVLTAALPRISVTFKRDADGSQHTILNGEDVENEIRGLEVSGHVSDVSAIPAVRHFLVEQQQAFGKEKGIVMDGRYIGTTVFPNAELKIFVDASARTRAERRFKELQAKGVDTTFDEVLANVESRALIARPRKESPLRKADDAIVLDNSTMTIDEQNRWLIDQYHNVISRLTSK